MELNSRNRYLLTTLFDYKFYLILPAMAGAFLALVYVLFFQAQNWTSCQRLMVRDDLLGQSFKPGQFSSFDTMKSRQETILDVARNPDVIRATLQQIGPASKSWFFNGEGYPDNRTIEQMQGQINLSAPNGAEFGTTEVVVLSVKAPSSQRSSDIISKLLVEVEKQIEFVRVSQLKSMESELIAARDNAKDSLQESIEQLRTMETTLGPDSIAMATMTSTMPGDNSIKAEILQILTEKRNFEAQLESLNSSRETLEESQSNPLLVVSSAASFFRDQVKLSELAKTFVESQGTYAVAVGRYHPTHPMVEAAAEQLKALKNQIANEFSVLEASLKSRSEELEHQISRLDNQINTNHERLMKLSDKRGEHLAINSEITKRTEMLNQFETNLKNVQSYKQGAGNNVWITRIGDPQVASQPDGLGKRSTVMAGGFLGLLFGAGLVVLLVPPYSPTPVDSQSASTTQDSAQGLANDSTRRPSHRPENSTSQSKNSRSLDENRTNRKQSELQPQSGSTGTDSRASARSTLGTTSESNAQVAESSSVKIPDVSEDPNSEQIEKFLAKKQSNANAVPEIANLDFAKEATTRMNMDAANQSAPAPDELLAALRAKRALETDPLAKTVLNESKVESGLDSIQMQISNLQQSTGTTISQPEIRLGIESNPFFSKSRKVETDSIPNQVKNLSNSILGLVEPNSKKSRN